MAKKFDRKNSQKCEAVRQAMRRVRRVGSERMPWATFYKEVSRLADFKNVAHDIRWSPTRCTRRMACRTASHFCEFLRSNFFTI